MATLFPMDLAFRELGGKGPAIVILHGLFGSSQNWGSMGRQLSSWGRVCALDLRNHGDSPHAATHTLADCVGDLWDWALVHADGPLRLIGHSMGGLVAMGFALAHPERTAGVAAVDIAPRPYPGGHEREIQALGTDLHRFQTRAEVDAAIAAIVPDARIRQFLLTNAVREGKGFRWRLNVPALAAQTLSAGFAGAQGTWGGAALLVACGRSAYVGPEDPAAMRRFFPAARIETITEADHWPQVSAPDALRAVLANFLARVQ
jgi:esterase